ACPCPALGELADEADGEAGGVPDDLDGEALSARDCAAVGKNFVDPLCPLCILPRGLDPEGQEVSVHCLAAGELQGKLLLCLPAASWRHKVAERTVPRGFLSKVFGAEVAAAASTGQSELPGRRFEFGWACARATPKPRFKLLLPLVDALAEL
ncbi:unnamed protein product, partial [Symbiodinium necroappetens]